jgi:hypothetical protein
MSVIVHLPSLVRSGLHGAVAPLNREHVQRDAARQALTVAIDCGRLRWLRGRNRQDLQLWRLVA